MMSGAKRTASQERIMKMQGRVSSSEKSERRHSAKSKALDKVKHLKVYSNKASYHFSPSKAQVSTEHGRKEAEKSGRKMYHNRMSFNK